MELRCSWESFGSHSSPIPVSHTAAPPPPTAFYWKCACLPLLLLWCSENRLNEEWLTINKPPWLQPWYQPWYPPWHNHGLLSLSRNIMGASCTSSGLRHWNIVQLVLWAILEWWRILSINTLCLSTPIRTTFLWFQSPCCININTTILLGWSASSAVWCRIRFTYWEQFTASGRLWHFPPQTLPWLIDLITHQWPLQQTITDPCGDRPMYH